MTVKARYTGGVVLDLLIDGVELQVLPNHQYEVPESLLTRDDFKTVPAPKAKKAPEAASARPGPDATPEAGMTREIPGLGSLGQGIERAVDQAPENREGN